MLHRQLRGGSTKGKAREKVMMLSHAAGGVDRIKMLYWVGGWQTKGRAQSKRRTVLKGLKAQGNVRNPPNAIL